MEHVIDLTTRIECLGIFTRFSDYQPDAGREAVTAA